VPYRPVTPVINPAPPHVPMHTASIMGHSRRMTPRSDGPAIICHTLVRSDGNIRIAAASTGGITMARRPIEIVGKPRPITPFDETGENEDGGDEDVCGVRHAGIFTRRLSPRNLLRIPTKSPTDSDLNSPTIPISSRP
jgi:hypothetical protein